MVATYNGKDAAGAATQGGYSTHIVVDEAFVLAMPRSVPLDRAAPLLCAGITVWSPMRHYGLDKKGMKIGVNGLGGLGHMVRAAAAAAGLHARQSAVCMTRASPHHHLTDTDSG